MNNNKKGWNFLIFEILSLFLFLINLSNTLAKIHSNYTSLKNVDFDFEIIVSNFYKTDGGFENGF